MKKRDRKPDSDETPNNPFGALAELRAGLPTGPDPAPLVAAATSSGDASASMLGGVPKIVVRREKKGRGGKTVTRIQGLPAELVDPLAGQLRKALGCGATVEAGDLILLGSLVDRAAVWLRERGARTVVTSS